MVLDTNITIGGSGGIGSYLVQWLGRQRPKVIEIYDHDNYEMVNAGSQFMFTENIGGNKAETSVALLIDFSGYFEGYSYGEYKKDMTVNPYVFTGFDKIEPRRNMFEMWKKNSEAELFIDGRLNMESFEIFTIPYTDKERMEKYEKHLFDDSEVEELACTMKATTHCGAMIASMMVSMFNNYLSNKYYESEVRELPFHLLYDMTICNLEILNE